MAFGCAAIEYVNYGDQHSLFHLAGSVAAAVAGIGLLVYGGFFYRKSKKLPQ